MLTVSLPLLPPPAASLLPPLHDRRNADPSNHDGQSSLEAQRQARRSRHRPHETHPRSHLATLAHDERLLEQRKMAIRMYGYSWLKPAGCPKTMLGRREEEIEREEVERQLREAELQEQGQAQMEEAQRQAHLAEQRAREARGEVVGEGERDLDEEVPDMDATADYDDDGSEADPGEEEGDVNLDSEIPEGDSGWAYDSAPDNPDTESENGQRPPPTRLQRANQPRPNPSGHLQSSPQQAGSPQYSEEDVGQQHDLDDDVADMDAELRDLDDQVPDADADESGWEHTDTEVEESDMDISIMPPGVTAHHSPLQQVAAESNRSRQPQFRSSGSSQQSEPGSSDIRRTSGNIPLPMGPPAPPVATSRALPRSHALPPNFTPDQPGSAMSVSALVSTAESRDGSTAATQAPRSWLDPASARRTLFGARTGPTLTAGSQRSFSLQQGGNSHPASQPATSARANAAPRQVSSGGLFTPSPRQQSSQTNQPGLAHNVEPQSRTRSGRVIDRARGGR